MQRTVIYIPDRDTCEAWDREYNQRVIASPRQTAAVRSNEKEMEEFGQLFIDYRRKSE